MRHARPGHGRRRPAFTLIEMLVVMWALTAALALGTALIVTALRSSGFGEAASQRLTRRAELAREFREDVARAEASPDKAGDVAAGPATLVLKMPGGVTVLYRRAGDALERVERAGGKETVRRLPLPRGDVRTEFARTKGPDGGRAVVTLRLAERRENGPEVVSEVSAALGGDWR